MPFSQAMKLPIFISRHVNLKKIDGQVLLEGKLRPGLIKIGYGDISIFDRKRSKSILEISGKLIFKGKASIGHGSKISVGSEGILRIGDGFKISAETSIICHKEIEIGDNCLMSWDIIVMDTDFHDIVNLNGDVLNPPKKISIGDRVWIGCRCTVLKGSIIPSDSIVAAASLISNELTGGNKLYGGVPAKILKSDVSWIS